MIPVRDASVAIAHEVEIPVYMTSILVPQRYDNVDQICRRTRQAHVHRPIMCCNCSPVINLRRINTSVSAIKRNNLLGCSDIR
jgi:hypothetical protein